MPLLSCVLYTVFPKCIKSLYWGDDPFRSINPKNRRILSNSEFYYMQDLDLLTKKVGDGKNVVSRGSPCVD